MRHGEFQIGGIFWCGGQRWRCTDVGTRVITAIQLDHEDDQSWYDGPPYAVAEVVFDEYDLEGCSLEPDPDDVASPSHASGDDVSKNSDNSWDSPDAKAKRIEQARALKEQASQGGLRFETYLPSDLAEWLLNHIARGTFCDPSEAVFVILGEHKDLEPHADLRRELLKRVLQAAMDDPRPGSPAEEVFERLARRLREPCPESAVWRKMP